MQLELGDRLFLFTDGLVEQASPRGEPFGFERLERLLAEHSDAEASALTERIVAALQAHAGRERFSDDVTLAVVEHTDRVDPSAPRP